MQDAAWYYAIDRQRLGPVAIEELQRLRSEGVVGASTLVWCDGMDGWKPLHAALPAVDVVAEPPLSAPPPVAEVAEPLADNPYDAPPSGHTPAILPLGDALEGDLGRYAAVVGGNFPIYRYRWRLEQGAPTAAGTWHWPGFFLGAAWFAYRRLYLQLGISLGLLVAGLCIDSWLQTRGLLTLGATLVVAIMGGWGYRLYLDRCTKELARAKALYPDDEPALRRELARRGDTQVPTTVLTLGALWLLFTLALGLFGAG